MNTDEAEKGETLQCEECGVDLEVVSIDPIELAPIDEAGYDDEDAPRMTDEDEE
jgi:alpha-aminoadipate carrier protein LysW